MSNLQIAEWPNFYEYSQKAKFLWKRQNGQIFMKMGKWPNFYENGQIFIEVSGQILNK